MQIRINNGKKTLTDSRPTVEDLKSAMPPRYREEDVIEETSDGLTRLVRPGERLNPRSTYHTIPRIVKGDNRARIQEEVKSLEEMLGKKSPVATGTKTGACQPP